MVTKPYLWESGATLEEHSLRKLKILREYFGRYLAVRCALPQQAKFRLAIVDGFAGGGRYLCGTPGSPLIFVEELRRATEEFNVRRLSDGMSPLDIECLLILNDESPVAVVSLQEQIEPMLASIAQDVPRLHIKVEYFNEVFEAAYPRIKEMVEQGRYRSVLFNLDQCGHAHVERSTLTDIMVSFTSAEIFYTFVISSLLAFLQKADPKIVMTQLGFLGITPADMSPLEGQLSNREWLGAAERVVFQAFHGCARFVSPFSINNPGGWRYWLIHFANNYRARQEYNNVLHQNSSMQAHFGRSGLHMLSYDPNDTANSLYLFDVSGRASAQKQLVEDIPRLVAEFGDTVGMADFYGSIYNMTPAHTDDIHAAIIENSDLEVVTEGGGERRKANTIGSNDMLRLKRQRSFFPLFFSASGKA
ncbi:MULTISPECIES: three-Cys-motif partner protein TcmP [unclassified Bradyrhizobium]|uniref:three-Cys-motif partner protein TcmP n=1 Tax=Bradyrhizobium TaxID=374 RepID=UPI002916AEE2|nr:MULTISPECIES: three-Cys-motif partner protein TcmP [unclassified Bradyrhizobium]